MPEENYKGVLMEIFKKKSSKNSGKVSQEIDRTCPKEVFKKNRIFERVV